MRSISVTLGLLFIALCKPSFAQKEEQAVRVTEGEPLTVECALRVEERAQWRRDGGAVPADMRPAGEAAGAARGGLTARLHAAAARAHHAGLYTCAAGARGVRVLVLPALEAAGGAEPAAGPAAAPAPEPATSVHAADSVQTLDYKLHGSFNLSCGAAAGSQEIVWKANDTALDAGPLKGRYKLEKADSLLKVERAIEDDYGNYSCEAGGAVAGRWELRAEPVLRLPKDTNVVEGQKLKLTCRVVGKPYPAVQWKYRADVNDAADNGTDVAVALGGRAVLATSAAGVLDGELVLEAAQRTDAGGYSCHYYAPAYNSSAETVVRVKDMYAALWPFLGICAEVFILCAVILVYEKRRPKRELDDSDTDNHDQKKS